MTFDLESQLCSALEQEWPQKLRDGHMINILREVRVGTLIPDLIAFHSWAPTQMGAHLPALTLFESAVVSVLVHRPLRASTIANHIFTRANRVQEVLDRFERRNLVKRRSRGVYSLCRASIPNHVEVIAVEAKLTRWREAVMQAKRYTHFANQVYVALPQATIENVFLPLLEECSEYGLGLLSVAADRSEFLVFPQRTSPLSPEWLWLVSRSNTPRRARHSVSVSGISKNARTPRAMTFDG